MNPFALFYLVQLTLAAVALRASAVVSLGVLMTGAFLWLWQRAVPLVMQDGSPVPSERLTQGFLTALVLAGGFVLTLLLALRRRSHRLQKERERLRRELESRERFLSVAALATGFAHELGTPLGTIALAAEEMKAHPDAETAAIILREAERCQRVLQRLRELGQEATGRSTEPCVVWRTVEATLDELPETQRARVKLDLKAKDAPVACAGLREALLVLLRNALLASTDEKRSCCMSKRPRRPCASSSRIAAADSATRCCAIGASPFAAREIQAAAWALVCFSCAGSPRRCRAASKSKTSHNVVPV